jgi:hypothetical protein
MVSHLFHVLCFLECVCDNKHVGKNFKAIDKEIERDIMVTYGKEEEEQDYKFL